MDPIPLSFIDTETSSIEVLRKAWPQAQLKQDMQNTGSIIENIFMKDSTNSEKMFCLFVKGTDFQIKVWKALVSILGSVNKILDQPYESTNKV